MTKNNALLIFFALVFGFRAFSDGVWDGPVRVCSETECNSLKEYLNIIYRVTNETYNDIDTKRQDIFYSNSNIKRYVSNLDTDQSGLLAGLNYETGAIDTLTTQMGYAIGYWNATSGGYGTQFRDYIDHIDCTLCSSGQCIDLTVVTNILSQVTSINTNLISLSSNVSVSFSNVTNYLSLLSVGVDNINTNLLDGFSTISSSLILLNGRLSNIQNSISNISNYVTSYLPYLLTIDQHLYNISSNTVVDLYWIEQGSLDNYRWNALMASPTGDFSQYWQQSMGPETLAWPYGWYFTSEASPFYSYVIGGFANLTVLLYSLNNYLSWMREYFLATNIVDLSKIEAGISSLSNIATRIDSYALGDFSNKFNEVWRDIGLLVSNSLYNASIASNLTEIVDGVNTNNLYLYSIDTKLDVLDYIKILSTTPLSGYSGDVDYYDYLTNLYINGSSSSGQVSTNWFERIEILLASLVFGDSDGTNGVPQGVQMDGVDSSAVESALTDFSYSSDFTSGIDSLDQTKRNFFQILHAFHNSVQGVTCPSSVSIGIGGLNGEDTRDFNDLMHGHFQVSFSVGSSDIFTTVVRSVTTICWVLVFLVIFWKAGFWLLRKMIYLYRVVNRLFWSVFTR